VGAELKSLKASNRPALRFGISCFALVVIWGMLLTGARPGSAASGGGFCRSEVVVRDFLRPIRALPRSHPLPRSGRLPFGPASFRLVPPRRQLVVFGRGGFELFGSITGSPRNRPLGWSVVSQLRRVDEDGRVLRMVEQQRQFISRIAGFAGRNFGFGGRVAPGLYRLDLTIETKDRRIIGRYSEFYRAIQARSDSRLAISGDMFEANATGFLRVENYGTVDTTYSYEYRIWRNDQGKRVKVPLAPLMVSNDRPLAAVGRAGHCFSFAVPQDAATGTYEIGVRVNNPLLDKPSFIFAQFRVD
jgi:hypothetical protein